MEEFLAESKSCLKNIESYGTLCIILGNESCDLDSAVSALLFARYLNHIKKHASIHLPVLNTTKEEFCLKTEVKYLFKRFNISSEHLIFRDDICLDTLKKSGKLKLVLVDHNVLANRDSHLDSVVVEIIDHHKQEHSDTKNVEMLIEPVGSCCSLIGSLILENKPEILDHVTASLLCGAILIDVANFSVTAKRATPKDEKVFERLSTWIPHMSKNIFYEELQRAKEDIAGIRLDQLFRKDMKVIEIGGVNLAICGFPCMCTTLLQTHLNLAEKLEQFCCSSNYQGAVLMGMLVNSETDTMNRDLIVFSKLAWLKTRLCQELERAEPNLQLCLVKMDLDYVIYNQKNVTASRKVILPMLKNILEKTGDSNYIHKSSGEKIIVNAISKEEKNPGDSSSASSSGIDTPTNSCIDGEGEIQHSPMGPLPEFNTSSEALSSIEAKKYLLFRRCSEGLSSDGNDPLTPENSFAESHFDQSYKKFMLNPELDTDAIEKKLRRENFFSDIDE